MMTKIELQQAEKNSFRGSLGALWSKEKTLFRLWQPFAEKAFVLVYREKKPRKVEMKRKKSVFEVEISGDLRGCLYEFAVLENGKTRVFADSYSRLVKNSRGVIVNMKENAPVGWEFDKPVCAESPVVYELSVRDFSMDENANFSARGKFSAFCEKGVKNKYGDICGLEYIKSLGVTHIQLMPVFDFDSDKSEYNWGYNPRFFNAPSGYYSRENGISELRSLIMSAHKMGMGVVADVVYNHVYDAENSVFEKQLSGYFFRGENGFSNGSGCGNEFASERKMARKFIIDSLEFLAREYHFDGFRFDLMGLLDIETLRRAEIKLRKINPDILLYGEGWAGGESALSEKFRAVQKNARRLSHFAFFNDSFRDAVRGNVFDVNDVGIVGGNAEKIEPITRAITGIYPKSFWTDIPAQTVNYIECHDNHTLYDRLRISLKRAGKDKIMRAEKTAGALLALTSGIMFIHAGQEFLRTKNFSSDSYSLPDSVNSIKWDLIFENSALVDYYRGLIAFRKRFFKELCGGCGGEISKSGGAFVLKKGRFLVIINPTNKNETFDFSGKYEIFADENFASALPLYSKKRLCCAKFSVLIARCKTVEKGN